MKKQNIRNKKLVPLMASVLMAPLYGYAGEAPDTGDTSDANTISVTGSTTAPEVVRLKMSPITSVVIGAEQLDKVKFTNPTELLNRIPGVSMSRNLRIPRGDKGYTIPLIDGLSLVNPYGGATGQIEDTNSEDIERIEVIYGPGSALYGNNAFGGVINVITKEPPKGQENRLWAEAGDHGRLRSGFTTKGTVEETSIGNVGYFLDANRWDIKGYRENSDDDRAAVSGKLIFHPSDESKLWVRGEHIERYEKGEAKLDQAEYDEDPRQNDVDATFTDSETDSASIGYSLNTDHGELLAGFSYRHDEGFSNPSWGGPSDNKGIFKDFKIQYRHDLQGIGGGMAASVTGGVEVIKGTSNTVSYESDWVTVEGDKRIETSIYAPFAQLELRPTEKAKITLGLRYEKIEYDVDDKFNDLSVDERTFSDLAPKLGFTYDFTPEHMMFAGVSKGYAAPGTSKLFLTEYANENLEAEVATNYEIGMRGSFDEQKLSYDVGLYYMNITDFIADEYVETLTETNYKGDETLTDKYTPVNAGKVNFRGLEAQLKYVPVDYIRFGLSYTYAQNKYVSYVGKKDDDGVFIDYSGNDLAISPEHHINARVTIIPVKDLEIELEMDSISDYYTYDINSLDPEGKYDRDDIYNLRANYERGPVELWASVLNLTDEKYATRAGYSTRDEGSRNFRVGNGRTLYVGAALNF